MKNKSVILGTGVFVVCFLVFGLLEILENPVIMILMILGYLAILGKILITKANPDKSEQKNHAERGS